MLPRSSFSRLKEIVACTVRTRNHHYLTRSGVFRTSHVLQPNLFQQVRCTFKGFSTESGNKSSSGTDYATTLSEKNIFESLASEIYCHGPLLHTVQMAGIYKDSKTFVDMKMKYPPTQIMKNFDLFMEKHLQKPTKQEIQTFVEANFDPEGSEFEAWDPIDWHAKPAFLQNISDVSFRSWANELHAFWKELGRKIKDDVKERPDMYSMIYLDHPVIVPGGRFREIFYWDSFWIMRGLILSEMYTTVKGMLLNLLQMVTQLGYVPNGGRIYFRRSQPPLLIPMFKLYHDAMKDKVFLRQNIEIMDQEFQFWIKNRTVTIDLKGRKYEVVRFNVEMDGPRPESYREDFELAEKHLHTEEEKRELYFNLKAGAESGWDYSTRWFHNDKLKSIVDGELIDTKTRHIIPVELNSFVYLNAKIMAEFYEELGDKEKTAYYQNVANQYRVMIEDVFWDEEKGCWFDYDLLNKKSRKFFYMSNIVPLWVGAYSSPAVVSKVIAYMDAEGVLKERGGVPTSMFQTGEQWDYPNGWAPLQYFLVDALDKADSKEAKELAYKLAEKWIVTNFKAFYQSVPNHMFEKYDVTVEGLPGGGGEYDVVVGFGWTNGVVLDFLNRFGDRLQAPLTTSAAKPAPSNDVSPAVVAIVGAAITLSSLIGALVCRKVMDARSGESSKEHPSYQPVGNDDIDETISLMQGTDAGRAFRSSESPPFKINPSSSPPSKFPGS